MKSSHARTAMVVSGGLLAIGALCFWIGSPLQVMVDLLFGWATFVANVGPRARFDWLAIGFGVVAAGLFLVGVHRFLNWWVHATVGSEGGAPLANWKFAWSVACVGLVLVAFAAGTALVGIAHQGAWVLSSPQPLTHEIRGDGESNVETNLRGLGLGIASYGAGHKRGARLENKMRSENSAVHSWITAVSSYEGIWLDKLQPDKAWDDPANAVQFRRLHPSVIHPQYDVSTWRDSQEYGLSHFAANANLMGPTAEGLKFQNKDGSNMILVGQVSENLEPWGKPANVRDPALGINQSPHGFGGLPSEKGAIFLMADGSVRFLEENIDPAVMTALGKGNVKGD